MMNIRFFMTTSKESKDHLYSPLIFLLDHHVSLVTHVVQSPPWLSLKHVMDCIVYPTPQIHILKPSPISEMVLGGGAFKR